MNHRGVNRNRTIRGVLEAQSGRALIRGNDGEIHFAGEKIWSGYVAHWTGREVCARHLTQVDYETGNPILIVWPALPAEREPYVALYYNERLVKYPASFFGHNAININGNIFNYSHLMNENEVMNIEEYFYRPARGEFAPSPLTGRFNIENRSRPYYDKFGRIFMRNIHVLRVEGIDTEALMNIFNSELDLIRNTPRDPRRPEIYKDFNFVTRSCSTIIRDGLRVIGYKKISGFTPRDLFVSAARCFLAERKKRSITVRVYVMKQLKVDEAPYSVPSPFLNPMNALRVRGIYGG